MTSIRQFQIGDQDQVVNLLQQLAGNSTEFDGEILLADHACNPIVLEENGVVIGFAVLLTYYLPTVGKIGRIEEVIVDENYRGKGFGRKITEALIEIAKEKELKNIQLTSNPKRVAARSLYESIGFEMKDTDVFVLDMRR